MAEARQAVGLQFAVSHDGGFHIDYDWEVVKLIFFASARSYKKRIFRLSNGITNGVFPFRLELIAAGVCLFSALYAKGLDVTFGFTDGIIYLFNIQSFVGRLCAILFGSLSTLLLCVFAVRFCLRWLFSYQGWIYMDRTRTKNPPLHIKIWMLVVNLLTSFKMIGIGPFKTKLYSYQGVLPTLPLPKLKDTLDRHLTSVRPLLNDTEYSEMVTLSDEFASTVGSKLQRYLDFKWWSSPNYVSDWWEEYVYLMGRAPIMINSNYYCLDALFQLPTKNQAARAGNIIHTAFNFRRILEKQEATPIVIHDVIPMCSRQYDRLFNTTRIPGVETDNLVHYSDSTHVVILHRGKFYRLGCYSQGKLLKPIELQSQIEAILRDVSVSDPGEEHLCALTASERSKWAQTRNKFFASGTNKISMQTIESAAFVIVLDEEPYDHDPNDPSKLSTFARKIFHGDGSDRWFDKSFCLIIGSNGRIGVNCEHSWADAPIIGHFWEYILAKDAELGYTEEGSCKGKVETLPPRATKLRWEINAEARDIIEEARKEASLLISDLDLHIKHHNRFGKGAMKKCKVSPDAFIQTALQLAYYRDSGGEFCLTYEASMTRLFREGRTETVRPCTVQVEDFVKAMDDGNVDKKTKIDLFRKTCSNHVQLYQDAMTGKGIDRHLFCLYVVSRYLEIKSKFLDKVLHEPWKLSTSQTAVRGEYSDVRKNPELISCGGGFGPVTDDGYGLSYILIGEDDIFFHASSKKSSSKTDSLRFLANIERALQDIRELNQ